MDEHNLLTIEEAAATVRAPVATLRYWRYVGSGPRSFRLGRRVVYLRRDVEDWIAMCAQGPTSVQDSAHRRPAG